MTLELVKMELWHGSDRVFHFPDHGVAADVRRSQNTRAANGGMGLWTSLSRPPRGQYGAHIYRVSVETPASRVRHMRIDELMRISRMHSPHFYRTLRKDYADLGISVLKLAEVGGDVQQAIIVDLACIRCFEIIA